MRTFWIIYCIFSSAIFVSFCDPIRRKSQKDAPLMQIKQYQYCVTTTEESGFTTTDLEKKDTVELYGFLGCSVEEVTKDCYTIKNCPKDCDGHDVGGPFWYYESQREGEVICSCNHYTAGLMAPLSPLPGAPALPPYKNCRAITCQNPDTNERVAAKESFINSLGHKCTCKDGSDPRIQDQYTRTFVHLECKPQTDPIRRDSSEESSGESSGSVSSESSESGEKEPKCSKSSEWYLYKDLGCTVTEVEDNCFTITECPAGCKDGHKEKDTWEAKDDEGDKQICECTHIGSVYYAPPLRAPGMPEYPPIIHCRSNGCTHPDTGKRIEVGDEISTKTKGECKCMYGPDTSIMDYSTLVHLSCELKIDVDYPKSDED